MSTKVKINKPIGGHKKGDTITVTPKTATALREAGVIDDTKPTTTKTKTDTKVEPKTETN